MFVRPEQIAAILARHPQAARARPSIDREGEPDAVEIALETAEPSDALAAALDRTAQDALKLRGVVRLVAPGSLPNDGKVIDDRRKYD